MRKLYRFKYNKEDIDMEHPENMGKQYLKDFGKYLSDSELVWYNTNKKAALLEMNTMKLGVDEELFVETNLRDVVNEVRQRLIDDKRMINNALEELKIYSDIECKAEIINELFMQISQETKKNMLDEFGTYKKEGEKEGVPIYERYVLQYALKWCEKEISTLKCMENEKAFDSKKAWSDIQIRNEERIIRQLVKKKIIVYDYEENDEKTEEEEEISQRKDWEIYKNKEEFERERVRKEERERELVHKLQNAKWDKTDITKDTVAEYDVIQRINTMLLDKLRIMDLEDGHIRNQISHYVNRGYKVDLPEVYHQKYRKQLYVQLYKELEMCIKQEECYIDILEDMYVSIKHAMGEKENFYLSSWFVEVVNDRGIEEIAQMNIKNCKKYPEKYEKLFGEKELNSISTRLHINSTAINVKRMWVLSSKFKILFGKATKDVRKYHYDDVCDELQDFVEVIDDFRLDDEIVMKRLFEMDYWYLFLREMKRFVGFEPALISELRDFICAMNGFPGYHVRCRMLKIIVKDYVYRIISMDNVGEKRKLFRQYNAVLHDIQRSFNLNYDMIAKKISRSIIGKCEPDELLRIIEQKRLDLIESVWMPEQYMQVADVEKMLAQERWFKDKIETMPGKRQGLRNSIMRMRRCSKLIADEGIDETVCLGLMKELLCK